MQSNTRDKAEGRWHQVKGKIKQVAGKSVGNRDLEAEGKAENVDAAIIIQSKEESMRQLNLFGMAVCILLTAAIAGCASGPAFNHSSEASKSAIRAADEVGAGELPRAALYLQLAREELERARVLAAEGDKEQAASLLTRAEADAELAITLSHEQSEKMESAKALERVRQLRDDNQLPKE